MGKPKEVQGDRNTTAAHPVTNKPRQQQHHLQNSTPPFPQPHSSNDHDLRYALALQADQRHRLQNSAAPPPKPQGSNIHGFRCPAASLPKLNGATFTVSQQLHPRPQISSIGSVTSNSTASPPELNDATSKLPQKRHLRLQIPSI